MGLLNQIVYVNRLRFARNTESVQTATSSLVELLNFIDFFNSD